MRWSTTSRDRTPTPSRAYGTASRDGSDHEHGLSVIAEVAGGARGLESLASEPDRRRELGRRDRAHGSADLLFRSALSPVLPSPRPWRNDAGRTRGARRRRRSADHGAFRRQRSIEPSMALHRTG